MSANPFPAEVFPGAKRTALRVDKKKGGVNGKRKSSPNKDKDGLETIGQYNLSQNDFVAFLKTGILAVKGI
ncbi:MAG: hypothetical protein U9N85_11080 [Bacteroidota bacterium]|nr:hypothetical protein [Bacteroidota bacterium]